MKDASEIKKEIINHRIKRGNFLDSLIARTFFRTGFLQINSKIFLGPFKEKLIEYELKEEINEKKKIQIMKNCIYGNLSELNLEPNQAYAISLEELSDLLLPSKNILIEFAYFTKKQEKWSYDLLKPKKLFKVSAEEIIPINEQAKETYNSKIKKMTEY